ncbi:WD40 repeat-like protein [Ascoidea rubescens DSM 1968]|uniref:WD40 repeat-like protein n=1 Tax=Ascoidea rubescens DSM 1968 TaxID=1344418 RepID=A0A1D2VPR2_9ASCO|nr:WD40 repeat-like protein [Ascoidea rubescens DSM 1968]ODV63612.1 WD40 repeat-like protein [Ascoidea rubescens DSM 1968]
MIKKTAAYSSRAHDSPITALAVSSSGRYVFTGAKDSTIRLSSISMGDNDADGNHSKEDNGCNNSSLCCEVLKFSKIAYSPISNIDLNTSNTKILISSGNSLIVQDIITSKSVKKIFDKRNWVENNDCKFLNDSLIVSVNNDNTLNFFDLKASTVKPIQSYKKAKDSLNCLAVSSNNYLVSTGSNDGNVYHFDLRSGFLYTDRLSKESETNPITSISLSNALLNNSLYPSFCLVGSLNTSLKMLDLNITSDINQKKTKKIEYLQRNTGTGFHILQSFKKSKRDTTYKIKAKFIQKKSDNFVISGSESGSVYIWNINPQSSCFYQLITSTENEKNIFLDAEYLPNFDYVVASNSNGCLYLWDQIYLNT